MQCAALFRIEVGTVTVEPLDRLKGDLVPLRVIDEWPAAVRDEIGEDEVSGFWGARSFAHGGAS
jgi:hypothetical protein